MNSGRIFGVVLRQYYLLRGSPVRILPIFSWVIIDIVMWGYLTRYLNTIASPGFNFVPAFLGAVLLWDFLVRVIHGVASAFFEDVWARNFLNLFSSPLTNLEYLSGLVITSLLTSSSVLVVMLLIATGIFGLSVASYGAMAIPFIVTLLLFAIALGILGISIVLRYGPPAEWLIWPLPALVSPFAGVFYPVATLPPWMQIVSQALPPAYVFESLRGIVHGEPFNYDNLTMGLSLACGYVVLAVLVFRKSYRSALRLGLIPRYSAESTS